MQKKLLQLILPLLLSATAVRAEDTVVFKNGDVLSGKILSQDETRVFFKSAAFGSVGLSMRDIAEIRTGTPDPVERAMAPEAAGQPPANAPIENKDPQTAEAASPSKPKGNWSAEAGVAIAMRERSNLDADGSIRDTDEFETYRIYGNLKWAGKKNDLKWSWNYRYSETDDEVQDDFFNITQNYRYSFSPRYYATSKSMYQRDVKRKIDREQLQTAELGIKWWESPKLQLSTSGGAAYHKYYLTQRDDTEYEGKFIFDQSLRWQLISSLTFFQNYTHLGDLENYHLVFASGLENKLIHNLFVQLEYRIDRDTEVNYDNKSYYDKALLTKLLYKF